MTPQKRSVNLSFVKAGRGPARKEKIKMSNANNAKIVNEFFSPVYEEDSAVIRASRAVIDGSCQNMGVHRAIDALAEVLADEDNVDGTHEAEWELAQAWKSYCRACGI